MFNLVGANFTFASKEAFRIVIEFFMSQGVLPENQRIDDKVSRIIFTVPNARIIFNYTDPDTVEGMGSPQGAVLVAVDDPLRYAADLGAALNAAGYSSVVDPEFEVIDGVAGVVALRSDAFCDSASYRDFGLGADEDFEEAGKANNFMLFADVTKLPPPQPFNRDGFAAAMGGDDLIVNDGNSDGDIDSQQSSVG